MSRLLLILALCLYGVFSQPSDNDRVRILAAKVEESNVSFEYSFVTKGTEVEISGSGNIVLQGDSFLQKGNGLAVWCDGISKWTVDEYAGEVVIESLEGQGIAANPALIVGSLESEFTWSPEGTGAVFNSAPATVYTLVPKSKETGIKKVLLYFKGAELSGSVLYPDDNTSIVLTISSLKFSAPCDMSVYALTDFDDSYIVTDLR